jgi:hypothetical protein
VCAYRSMLSKEWTANGVVMDVVEFNLLKDVLMRLLQQESDHDASISMRRPRLPASLAA